MLGSHLIRTYSKSQSVVAKSSGESEIYGVVRAWTEGLGTATLLFDFGVSDPKVSIGMDAIAAMGMAQRVGLQKVRHVDRVPVLASTHTRETTMRAVNERKSCSSYQSMSL